MTVGLDDVCRAVLTCLLDRTLTAMKIDVGVKRLMVVCTIYFEKSFDEC